jgi:hypothetical protein
MAALIYLSGTPSSGETLAIDYSRQQFLRADNGSYVPGDRHSLSIANDGRASYGRTDGSGNPVAAKTFSVSREEMTVLRDLFLNTGFMEISIDSKPRPDSANYTRYQLSLRSAEDDQLLTWVNPESSAGPVPAIVSNAGTRLDAIIQRQG